VRLMHSLILVWFLSPFQLPNSQCGAYSQQRYKHQYCFVRDCILHQRQSPARTCGRLQAGSKEAGKTLGGKV
jgi:hypothetical protein